MVVCYIETNNDERFGLEVSKLESIMTIKRYGVEGGIVDQSRLAIQNCVDIMTEAG
jgi:hypothetical protein